MGLEIGRFFGRWGRADGSRPYTNIQVYWGTPRAVQEGRYFVHRSEYDVRGETKGVLASQMTVPIGGSRLAMHAARASTAPYRCFLRCLPDVPASFASGYTTSYSPGWVIRVIGTQCGRPAE